MIDKINRKIDEYLQNILDKDEISKEEFDLLVAYRNAEESRSMMKQSMEMLQNVNALGAMMPTGVTIDTEVN